MVKSYCSKFMIKGLVRKPHTKFGNQVILNTFYSGDRMSTIDITDQWDIRYVFDSIEKMQHSKRFSKKKFEKIFE